LAVGDLLKIPLGKLTALFRHVAESGREGKGIVKKRGVWRAW